MRYWNVTALVPAIMLAVACNRNNDRAAADSALRNDLNLANQVAPTQDTISPTESGYAPATGANTLRSSAPSSQRTASRATSTRSTSTRRTTTRRTSGSSGGGRVATSSGGEVSAPARAPAPTVVKHTKRDAAIGAAAGAVIGATTSRDKLKGAVIGGVVGGVLGGVIGNNVDKTKKP